MIISVASGKGGTGKTLVATSLALSLKDSHKVMLLDCDVEEPNAHVFLKPAIASSEAVVCINKYDLNEENTRKIESYCAGQGIRMAARIPFDNAVTEAMVRGVPVVEYSDGKVSREIKRLWDGMSGML